MGAARSRIGYMPENDSFIGDMTAVAFVRQMAELSGLPPGGCARKGRTRSLFHVGLGEARYRELRTYSLGMKQMAKLAQAIVHGPELVVLDEPTNGLDPAARRRMLKLIAEMKNEQGMNVLVCSHLLRDIEQVCDEAVIMKDGAVVHQCNLEEERRSNRSFVELEVTGDDGNLRAALPEIGAEGVPEGSGRWRIVLPPGVEVDAIWAIAGAAETPRQEAHPPPGHAGRDLPESHGASRGTRPDGRVSATRDTDMMAVYKRGYRRYAGATHGAMGEVSGAAPIRLATAVPAAPRPPADDGGASCGPLLCAGFIYLRITPTLLQGLEPEFRQFIQVDGRFFSIFMYVQAGFAVFLAALAGPGLIAPDLANNALPLYFSRPLTRWSYALARLTVLVGMLSVVTWIPGLVLFGLQVGLAGGWWFRGELDAGCRDGRRVLRVAAGPEPGGDGQLRVREVEGRRRRGEPGLLLHPERRRRR